jgi:hypothetical protein
MKVKRRAGVAFEQAEILEAFARLGKSVNHAFSQSPELPASVENERERYVAALYSVAVFFGRFKAPFADRFFELGAAIADLNSGTKHGLLTRSHVDHRQPDSSQLWRARARVALGLYALMQSGETQGDAAKEIETKYQSLKALAGTKAQVLSKTVINWYKGFIARRIVNCEAVELFAVGKQIVEALNGKNGDLRKFAEAQLVAAAELCGVLTPRS